MRFIQIDKHHLRAGDWTICKCGVGCEIKYQLWRGNTLIDVFSDAESAKKEAEKGRIN